MFVLNLLLIHHKNSVVQKCWCPAILPITAVWPASSLEFFKITYDHSGDSPIFFNLLATKFSRYSTVKITNTYVVIKKFGFQFTYIVFVQLYTIKSLI